jgi:hypothetical protein
MSIRRGFAPDFVNYKKGARDSQSSANDKVYQLLAHGRWFSLGTPASSTTKTGRHDIAEIGIASNLYGVHLKFMIIRVNSVIGSTLDGWTCKRKSTTVVYMETSEMRNN